MLLIVRRMNKLTFFIIFSYSLSALAQKDMCSSLFISPSQRIQLPGLEVLATKDRDAIILSKTGEKISVTNKLLKMDTYHAEIPIFNRFNSKKHLYIFVTYVNGSTNEHHIAWDIFSVVFADNLQQRNKVLYRPVLDEEPNLRVFKKSPPPDAQYVLSSDLVKTHFVRYHALMRAHEKGEKDVYSIIDIGPFPDNMYNLTYLYAAIY